MAFVDYLLDKSRPFVRRHVGLPLTMLIHTSGIYMNSISSCRITYVISNIVYFLLSQNALSQASASDSIR